MITVIYVGKLILINICIMNYSWIHLIGILLVATPGNGLAVDMSYHIPRDW